MLIFDEKKYAQKILKSKKYNTLKNQGRERCAVVRYLHDEGLSNNEILNELFSLSSSYYDYLTDKELIIIYNKIIDKAMNFPYIHDKNVIIYKSEIDIINSIDNEDERNLLFVYLVYYKWAKDIFHLSFYSRKNEVDMVVENDNDLWKLANLSRHRVSRRYMLCNNLVSKGLYKLDNFKSYNYFYIPFAVDNGEIAITISNFDNILGELFLYNREKGFTRCDNCGVVIQKNNNKQKYCKDCAKEINIEKTLKSKVGLK